jgi:hypothetical protein
MATYKQPTKVATADVGKGPSRNKLDTVDMSAGNIDKSAGEHGAKTSGIKIRGTGAATKGVMARGPMA